MKRLGFIVKRDEIMKLDWVVNDEIGALFSEGLALFNAGRFFESHEVWEAAWKRVSGDEKLFLQGLIQAAAALLQVQRGRRAGALSLLQKSKVKLELFPTIWMGVELGEFRRGFEDYVTAVIDGGPPSHPPILRRSMSAARLRKTSSSNDGT
ncbi:MAG: DUF309 domain-containing protein [Candidatus Binataceae bacterium]